MNNPPGFIASLFGSRDEQAMERLQNGGDHQAFAELVDRWERPILRLCAKMTGDLGRAEDLKQETFARVFCKRQSFRAGMRFSTWLWRIALNLCFDELRRTNRRGESSLQEMVDAIEITNISAPEPAPDLQTAASEESQLVRDALMQIPEISRVVLVLRFCQELKIREVAEILALPETTVRHRLAEGLARITRILEPNFGPSPSEGIAADGGGLCNKAINR